MLLRHERQLGYAVAGIQTVLFSVGFVVGSAAYPKLVRHVGRHRTGLAESVVLSAGVLLFVADVELVVVSLGSFVAGIGGAGMVTAASATLAGAGSIQGMARLSLANAAGSLASMLALLVIGISVAANVGWRLALVAVVPSLIILELWNRSRGRTAATPPIVEPDGRMPRLYWQSVLGLTLLIAAESCLGLWGPDLIASRTGAPPAERTAALALLFGGLAVGRLIAARSLQVVPVDSLFTAGVVLAIACFLVLWSSTDPSTVLIALFLLGAALSLNLPFGQSRAVLVSGGRADRASAGVFLSLGLAGLGVPFLLAVLADQVGVHNAFLIVPALLAGGFVTMRLGRQRAATGPEPVSCTAR